MTGRYHRKIWGKLASHRADNPKMVTVNDICLRLSVLFELLLLIVTWNTDRLIIQLMDARFHDALTAKLAGY